MAFRDTGEHALGTAMIRVLHSNSLIGSMIQTSFLKVRPNTVQGYGLMYYDH